MLLSGLDSRPLNKLNLQSLSGSWSVPIDRRYVICPSIICPTHHLSYTVGENFICPTHHAFVLNIMHLSYMHLSYTSFVLQRGDTIVCSTLRLYSSLQLSYGERETSFVLQLSYRDTMIFLKWITSFVL